MENDFDKVDESAQSRRNLHTHTHVIYYRAKNKSERFVLRLFFRYFQFPHLPQIIAPGQRITMLIRIHV